MRNFIIAMLLLWGSMVFAGDSVLLSNDALARLAPYKTKVQAAELRQRNGLLEGGEVATRARDRYTAAIRSELALVVTTTVNGSTLVAVVGSRVYYRQKR